MSSLQQRRNQVQRLSIKRVVVVASSFLVFAMVLFFILNGSLFSAFNSDASIKSDFENGREYWMMNSIEPSSFSNSIDIDIKSKFNGTLIVKLSSLEDELLVKESVNIVKGDNLYTLQNLTFLTSGVYLLELSGEDKTIQEEIIKQ